MKYLPLLLCFLVVLSVHRPGQANERGTTDGRPESETMNLFATVNGRPLGMDLYQFLLGSRQQQVDERLAYGDDVDAARHRRQAAEDLVMTELLAQQAVELGLDRAESVRIELAMAEKTLLAQLYVQRMMDSMAIDEAQIRQHYDQQPEQTLYRFLIWQVPGQQQAVNLLKALEAGIGAASHDMEAIETPWLQSEDISPEVNLVVSRLNVQDFVKDPLYQDGVWKVVQLIDKQVMAKQSYAEARELIKAELVRVQLDKRIAALAESASIVFSDQYVSQSMK